MKCPQCGSEHIHGLVKIYLIVDVYTGKWEEGLSERYEDDIYEEFNCDACDHIWLGEK